jgi:6-phospho-beta-glucosidase
METGNVIYTALNVPNRGSITRMAGDDVVEISCRVDGTGVHVLPIGEIPASQLELMRAVKLYERLTVRAIREHSRMLAVQALMAHPLVLSYSRAKPLVDEYLTAHQHHIGEWS